jgi:hypothetical protein
MVINGGLSCHYLQVRYKCELDLHLMRLSVAIILFRHHRIGALVLRFKTIHSCLRYKADAGRPLTVYCVHVHY